MAQYQPNYEAALTTAPYSLEAEQSILGGMLLSPDVVSQVMEVITRPEMFYRKQHRDLFSVLVNMFNTNRIIDFVTVMDEVNRAGVFDSPDSAKSYLVQLMEMVPTTANIPEYCHIVQDKYYIRTLMAACTEIMDRAAEGDAGAQSLLELAEQRIYNIRQGKDATAMARIDTVIIEAYDRLLQLTGEDREKYEGLRTGFSQLDLLTAGLNKSDLIIVAARPGVGKSSFALNIALNVARRYPDKAVAIFSLEMSNEQLILRAMSSEARIPNDKFRTGRLAPDEWVTLASVSDILSKTQIYFDDTAGISTTEMKAKLTRLKNLGLVVIDYLQLMQSSGGRASENRVQEISQITRSLKIMAKELDVPVILLSQLSRAAEQRSDHRPMLSDLRDSGSIEQDADIILFLMRKAYYEGTPENLNEASCLVAKNRHGSTGDLDLRWLGEYTRFEEVDRVHDEPPY